MADERATPEQLAKMNELLTDYGLDYAAGLSGLHEDLRSDSALQVILRGHLWVEAEIVALLSVGVRYPIHLDLDRMQFPNKVKLAVALGLLDEQWLAPLLQLNAERNKLTHRLDHRVTKDAEVALMRSLPGGEGATGFPGGLRMAILAIVVSVSKARRFAETGAPLRLKWP